MRPEVTTIEVNEYLELCEKRNAWTGGPLRVVPTEGTALVLDERVYIPRVPTEFVTTTHHEIELELRHRKEESLPLIANYINLHNCPNLTHLLRPYSRVDVWHINASPAFELRDLPHLTHLTIDRVPDEKITADSIRLRLSNAPFWHAQLQAKTYEPVLPRTGHYLQDYLAGGPIKLTPQQWDHLRALDAIWHATPQEITTHFDERTILAAGNDIENLLPSNKRQELVGIVQQILKKRIQQAGQKR